MSAFTHATVSVSSYVCILLSLKGLDSIPSGSSVLSSLFKEFCPEERGLLRDIFLGLSVPQSFTLCILSVSGALYLFISAAGKKAALIMVVWIYGYSRTSLGVTLLLCSFSRTVVFGFP